MSRRPVHFVIGSGRSGTTLLRVMLAGHPQLFSPPEMVLAPYDTMAERTKHMEARFWEKGGLRRAVLELTGSTVDEAKEHVARLADKTVPEVYDHLQELVGDKFIIDKCPHLAMMPERLPKLLEWYPEARFVWIVRHPGSVIKSWQNMPMAEVMLGDFEGGAEGVWRSSNENCKQFLATLPEDRWCRVTYEDLVNSPETREASLRRICDTLGLEYAPAMADPYGDDKRMISGPKGARAIGDPNMAGRKKIDPSLATKWLRSFDPRSVSAETKALATELGYDLDALDLPPIARLSDAMQSLFDYAKKLEKDIDLPMDLDAVEGRRFLLRMLAESVDTFVEHSTVDNPEFRHAEGPHRKMFADNPDTDYLRAPIRLDDGRVYALRGRIPEGTNYAGILYYGKGGRIGNRFVDQDIPLNADRSFEIRLATTAQEGFPTLVGDGDETAVMVRQYFTNRDTEEPLSVEIELLGEPPAPTPLDASWMARRIYLSERMLKAVFERTLMAYQMANKAALNQFIQIPGEALFPTPDNTYQVCWYRFGRDQCMRVRAKLPTSRYFSLVLYNAWMESLDYTRHTISLNHTEIEADEDGMFEVVLSHRDLGQTNRLDTAGHHAGFLLARNLLLEGEPPQFEIQVQYEHEFLADE
ncbi:MAG: sulfotransferase [Deltaproteobacteria bacterium]|nr:MAG: sulfotransferase [Deltaproteobacteria bacterium]